MRLAVVLLLATAAAAFQVPGPAAPLARRVAAADRRARASWVAPPAARGLVVLSAGPKNPNKPLSARKQQLLDAQEIGRTEDQQAGDSGLAIGAAAFVAISLLLAVVGFNLIQDVP